MAKLKEAFVKDVMQQQSDGHISFSRMVEMLNEEAKRELTAEEAGLFARPECVYKYCPSPEQCKDKCVAGY